jgi:hypothetical protein
MVTTLSKVCCPPLHFELSYVGYALHPRADAWPSKRRRGVDRSEAWVNGAHTKCLWRAREAMNHCCNMLAFLSHSPLRALHVMSLGFRRSSSKSCLRSDPGTS